MLESLKLAERIRKAMDDREPPLSGKELAAACKVTAQAVSGWRKTGRIHKMHLEKLAELTRRPVGFFLSGNHDRNGLDKAIRNPAKVIDETDFRTVQRAWQDATTDNRKALLALAKTILKLDGNRKGRRAS